MVREPAELEGAGAEAEEVAFECSELVRFSVAAAQLDSNPRAKVRQK